MLILTLSALFFLHNINPADNQLLQPVIDEKNQYQINEKGQVILSQKADISSQTAVPKPAEKTQHVNSKPALKDGKLATAPLAVTRWKLAALNTLQISEDNIYLIFNHESHDIQGSTGCNRLSGHYVLAINNELQFTQIATTQRACLQPQKQQREAMLLNMFKSVRKFNIENGSLYLHNEQGNIAAHFTAIHD